MQAGERGRGRRRALSAYAAAVVEYVYQSRFATASQIERRFPEWLRSTRTTQGQLAEWVARDLLALAPVRSTSPNFPYVYYATGRGVRLVNDTYREFGVPLRLPPGEDRKAGGVTVTSLLHELLVTEFELAVRRTVGERSDLKLLFTERRYFRRGKRLAPESERGGTPVIPDAGFLIAGGGGSEGTSHNVPRMREGMLYFVELDNGTLPLARIRQKFAAYGRWADSTAGAEYLHVFYSRYGVRQPQAGFRLVVIGHDPWQAGGDGRRLVDLFSQGLTLPAAMRDRLWLTTVEDLRAVQDQSPPLSAKIWLRGRDAKAWQASFRQSAGANAAKRHRREIANRLANLPRHPLFPSPLP